MRVTGGVARGIVLRTTDAREMRPTTDATRKAIFDILGDRVVDAVVLDLFAGAGGLGIDALSRGARHATFVERDRRACAVIERNLHAAHVRDRATVRRSDVSSFLARRGEPADLVLLDPPYDAALDSVIRTLRELTAGSWIRSGGTVVVEAPVGQVTWPSGFRETRTRRSGRTQVSMAEADGSGDLSRDI